MARTKKQLKALHVELWNWLAENPEKSKDDWPRWEFNRGTIKEAENLCFACEAADVPTKNNCDGCTCSWGEYSTCEPDEDGYSIYEEWKRKTGEERTKYALQVRDCWR